MAFGGNGKSAEARPEGGRYMAEEVASPPRKGMELPGRGEGIVVASG